MKKVINCLFAGLLLLTAVSCDNDKKVNPDDPFFRDAEHIAFNHELLMWDVIDYLDVAFWTEYWINTPEAEREIFKTGQLKDWKITPRENNVYAVVGYYEKEEYKVKVDGSAIEASGWTITRENTSFTSWNSEQCVIKKLEDGSYEAAFAANDNPLAPISTGTMKIKVVPETVNVQPFMIYKMSGTGSYSAKGPTSAYERSIPVEWILQDGVTAWLKEFHQLKDARVVLESHDPVNNIKDKTEVRRKNGEDEIYFNGEKI